jgi:hypothetical protein
MSEGLTTFGAARRVRVLVHRGPAELRAWLIQDSGDSYTIRLRGQHPASLRVCTVQGHANGVTEHLPHAWAMTRGPRRVAATRDPFLMATKWVYRALYPPRDGAPGDPDARGTMRRVYATLASVARDAAAACEPAARAIVMRFQPHLRFWLYRHLVADPSGRLAQLASVCPGALIFSFALERSGYADQKAAGARLLGAVIAGQRLARVLSEAVGAWAAGASERAFADVERIDPVRIPARSGRRFRRDPGADSAMTRALDPEHPGT